MISAALTHHKTITEVVAVYREAAQDIEQAFAKLAEVEKKVNATFTLEHWSTISIRSPHCHHSFNFERPEDVLVLLRRDLWRSLVQRLELRRMLSVRRAKELDVQLERGELPDITEEAVASFVQFYIDHMGDMLGEAVEEVFDFLRPRGSQYKTNTELEIGPKVILGYAVEPNWSSGFRVTHNRSQQFTAMENVFTMLDGKGSISKTHYSALENAIKEAARGETPYFSYKCFKNGNLHLGFRRPDLLKRFNEIAGGRRLRPADPEAV